MIKYYERLNGEYARLYRTTEGGPVEYWSSVNGDWVRSLDAAPELGFGVRITVNDTKLFRPLTSVEAQRLEPKARL